jgi:hypothetical protein
MLSMISENEIRFSEKDHTQTKRDKITLAELEIAS